VEKAQQHSEIQSIAQLREQLALSKRNWLYSPGEEHSDDFATVYFIAKHQGQEKAFDATIYTLPLHYASTLHEAADAQLMKLYPDYEGWESIEEEDEELEEERATIIAELEAEGSMKVQEFVEIEDEDEEWVILNASLNVDEITADVIHKFVKDFQSNTLRLDDTLYAFSLEEEE